MTRSTRASTVGADASPAKARTGALTASSGAPVTSAISCGVSAMLTNRTPSRDSDRHSTSDGPVRYTAPSVIFENRDRRRVDVGGFQPFESYDNALANLDLSLERRAAPSDPLEALAEFPHGLTTAEVASVMRPSDLAEEDRAEAARALLSLASDGAVACEPAGADALWRARRTTA